MKSFGIAFVAVVCISSLPCCNRDQAIPAPPISEKPKDELPTRKEYVAPPKADDRLEFSPPRKEYVLGEPVLFDLRLHNRSKAPINVLEVFVESHRSEARLWIAAKGDIF